MVERDLNQVRRVVVKVGTNLISDSDGIDLSRIDMIVRQIAILQKRGINVLLVTSGAVGLGARELGLRQKVQTVVMRQTCASIGQPILMSHYRAAFAAYHVVCSQVLITKRELNDRKTFVNLKNSVTSLLEHNVVPIFNENDTVSTDEVGSAVGDNDRLGAFVASKIDADLLILLTDIDGLYSQDPRIDSDAHLIHEVSQVDEQLLKSAGSSGSQFSTGGMRTKLLAARIASHAGCATVIASGFVDTVLTDIIEGRRVGTYFSPDKRLNQRIRWILNSATKGTIWIDDGAIRALKNHKSLLPSGIVGVEGAFEAGEVVMVNRIAKAVPYYNSSEIMESMGHQSSDVGDSVKKGRPDVIFRPEDLVFLDYAD
ncbi:MAG: glutamate 5-kinase [Sphaerochaetaceae bacterium]|nr:glutamate 5-kinase [Sphaerochaetaceae bacterium]